MKWLKQARVICCTLTESWYPRWSDFSGDSNNEDTHRTTLRKVNELTLLSRDVPYTRSAGEAPCSLRDQSREPFLRSIIFQRRKTLLASQVKVCVCVAGCFQLSPQKSFFASPTARGLLLPPLSPSSPSPTPTRSFNCPPKKLCLPPPSPPQRLQFNKNPQLPSSPEA